MRHASVPVLVLTESAAIQLPGWESECWGTAVERFTGRRRCFAAAAAIFDEICAASSMKQLQHTNHSPAVHRSSSSALPSAPCPSKTAWKRQRVRHSEHVQYCILAAVRTARMSLLITSPSESNEAWDLSLCSTTRLTAFVWKLHCKTFYAQINLLLVNLLQIYCVCVTEGSLKFSSFWWK